MSALVVSFEVGAGTIFARGMSMARILPIEACSLDTRSDCVSKV